MEVPYMGGRLTSQDHCGCQDVRALSFYGAMHRYVQWGLTWIWCKWRKLWIAINLIFISIFIVIFILCIYIYSYLLYWYLCLYLYLLICISIYIYIFIFILCMLYIYPLYWFYVTQLRCIIHYYIRIIIRHGQNFYYVILLCGIIM